jgi:PPOX class probable F420-dependent enzyme
VKLSQSEINEFLDGVHIARVATTRPDGRPHIAPVWYLWEDDTLYFESESRTVKTRNLRLNPNIAISVDITAGGLRLKYVILEGRVEFIENLEAVKKIANRVYSRYMGQEALDTRSVQEMLKLADLIVSLKPTRFITMDYL